MSQITRLIVFFPQKFWPRKFFGKIYVHQSPLLKSLSLFYFMWIEDHVSKAVTSGSKARAAGDRDLKPALRVVL